MRVTEFLEPFFPDAHEPLFIFGYSPKELPEELKEHPARIQTSRDELRTNRDLQDRLKRLNQTQGIYFTVNAGGTKKEEINRINAVFCEIDDIPIPEQHDVFDNAEYPPSVRVETKKSVHSYFLLKDSLTIDEFVSAQKGLIQTFRSDKAIKNQNRVMRLPGFNHVSFELGEYIYKPVTVHTFNDQTRFTLEELLTAYPAPIEPVYTKVDFQEMKGEAWEGVFAEVVHRIQSLPSYHVEHGGKLASAQGVCHGGDTNRTLVHCLDTNRVFCRNECTYRDIMRALGVEAPQPKLQRRTRKPQTSALARWFYGENQ